MIIICFPSFASEAQNGAYKGLLRSTEKRERMYSVRAVERIGCQNAIAGSQIFSNVYHRGFVIAGL